MNGAGGNSTRLLFDDDDDFNTPTYLASIMYSLAALTAVLLGFKLLYERWITPLSHVPGRFLHSVSSIPMRYNMIRGSLPQFLLSLHQQYGPIVRIAPQRVSIADPAMLKHVLGSHTFAKTPSYDMPSSLEPNTFSTRVGELSDQRRRQIGPGFSHRHLAQMEEAVAQCAVFNLRDVLARNGQREFQYNQGFSLLALDIIGSLGFGCDFDALRSGGHQMVGHLQKIRIFNYVTMAFPWLKKLPNLLGRRMGTLYALIDFAHDAIDRRRHRNKLSEQASEEPKQPDLLQMMLDVGRSEGDRRQTMTDAQMVSETILNLLAGVDTTSVGLTWTLALILHNPHVMQRLVAEIRTEFPPSTDPASFINYEACKRLPYLTAVINESLRIMSPTPGMLPRLAPRGGLRLAGYVLPQGTWLCCSIGAVHMNPKYFPEPEVFSPDRFLTEKSDAKQNLLAFSTGVRACLGRNLALFEMHLVIANLLRDYDLALPADAAVAKESASGVLPTIPRRYMMTNNPANPDRDCRVTVTKVLP
ncbi:hypothetical protein LPJ53_004272 [Coemansia erecta]|uniref:Cytochrome P450 n=1 Tax=Coemansia erecta TaxID=147472 RepID=A0A9W7XUN5_9FUNG|nr:hypothetical protein LPJ53_004272 [Coemansia erecta]